MRLATCDCLRAFEAATQSRGHIASSKPVKKRRHSSDTLAGSPCQRWYISSM